MWKGLISAVWKPPSTSHPNISVFIILWRELSSGVTLTGYLDLGLCSSEPESEFTGSMKRQISSEDGRPNMGCIMARYMTSLKLNYRFTATAFTQKCCVILMINKWRKLACFLTWLVSLRSQESPEPPWGREKVKGGKVTKSRVIPKQSDSLWTVFCKLDLSCESTWCR